MNTSKFCKLGIFSASVLLLAACGSDDKQSQVSSDGESMDELMQSRDSLQRVIADQDSLLSLVNEPWRRDAAD